MVSGLMACFRRGGGFRDGVSLHVLPFSSLRKRRSQLQATYLHMHFTICSGTSQ